MTLRDGLVMRSAARVGVPRYAVRRHIPSASQMLGPANSALSLDDRWVVTKHTEYRQVEVDIPKRHAQTLHTVYQRFVQTCGHMIPSLCLTWWSGSHCVCCGRRAALATLDCDRASTNLQTALRDFT
eukprot:654010-Rhodomonas_salina.2